MNEISPNPNRPAAANGQGATDDSRDWYYRLGERERGPLTLVQLKDLVASSGEMAREIVVRRHADGEWMPYEAVDAATARRLHADRPIRPPNATVAANAALPSESMSSPASFAKRGPGFVGKLRLNREIVAGALIWAGVNLVLWYVLDPFHRTENRYFQALSRASQKAHDARALGSADRGRIAAAVIQEVKPIVEELKKTANASDPIRQHLLWAGKDQLPRLFSAEGKGLKECEGIYQRHLYEAGRRLGIDVARPATQVTLTQ
jgi:hypothetical protein